MELYIKQRVFTVGAKYDVVDSNSNPVFYVQGKAFTFGAKITLFDNNDNELFYIKQNVFRLLPEYEIYSGDTLFAIVKKKPTFFRPSITVTGINSQIDIDGDFWAMDFSILKDGSLIGHLSKEWFTFGDAYSLNIPNASDAAFFTALVITVDTCLHNN